MDIVSSSEQDVKINQRRWLAGKLRRADVPDWLWEELAVAGLLDGKLEALLREAKRRLRAIRTADAADLSQLPSIGDLLVPAEMSRAWAFSEYIASQAANDRDVQCFRTAHLEGGTVSKEEGLRFLGSHALRFLSADSLRALGIPIRDHKVVKYTPTSGPAQDSPRLTTGPPPFQHTAKMEIVWDGGSVTIAPQFTFSGAFKFSELSLPSGDVWYPFAVWPGSVYDELRMVIEALIGRFPWNEPDATIYVLTGETPFIPPMYVEPIGPKTGAPGHVSMKLSIEPWISAQTVTRLYKVLKRAVYPGRSRSLSEKNIALFRFVTRHAKPGDEIPSFENLLKLWNQEQSDKPDWQYESAWTLARDYRRTGHMIVFPRYRGPGERA